MFLLSLLHDDNNCYNNDFVISVVIYLVLISDFHQSLKERTQSGPEKCNYISSYSREVEDKRNL